MNVLPVYTTDKEDSGWWNDVPAQFIFRADSVTRVRNFISCYYVIASRLIFIVYIVTGPLSCSPSCYGTIHSAYGEIISRFFSVHYIRGLLTSSSDEDSGFPNWRQRRPVGDSVLDYSPAWLLCEEGILQSCMATLWRRYITVPLDYSVKKLRLSVLFTTTSVSVSTLVAVQNLRVL